MVFEKANRPKYKLEISELYIKRRLRKILSDSINVIILIKIKA